MKSGKESYYDILGVDKSATPDQIKKAFRKKAREHHPDVGGSEEDFKRINEAYEVLSDPQKKKEYDLYGSMGGQGGQWTGGSPFDGYDFSDFDFGGTGSMWSEFVENFRQASGESSRSKRNRKGQELQVSLELTFEEAFNGCTKRVAIRIPSTGEKQTMDVRVPAGAVDGGKLRYRGKGEYGSGKGERGDLIIVTKVKHHRIYSRDGADVIMELPVSIDEAALGANVTVPAPDGTCVKLRIPAGTQTGKVLRIPGKGAKDVKSDSYGALNVHVKVVVPVELNSAQKASLEAFRAASTGQNSVRPAIDAKVKEVHSNAHE